MRSTSIVVLLLLALLPTARGEAQEEGAQMLVETVAPGVVTVLQPREGWVNDSNSVVIRGGGRTLIVDAQAGVEAVERTIAEAEKTPEHPVRFLVNTHWHSDHTQGNALYRERYGSALTILGHESLSVDVPERAGGYIAEQRQSLEEIVPRAEVQLALGLTLGGEALDDEGQLRQRRAIDEARAQLAAYEGLELVAPELTYPDRLTLWLGEREVRLLHFRAHTDGDTVLYLPAEKILVSGDLLDVMPFAGHGHFESWIETLDTLADLEIEHIIPGHGPIFDGKAQLRLVRDYIQAILESSRAARARGDLLEKAQEVIDLSRFREALAGTDPVLQRNFDAMTPEAIARAYEELERQP